MADTKNLELKYMHRPVANLAALQAINTASIVDGIIITIKTLGIWKFNKTSTETADNLNVVEPTAGGGRWFRNTMPEFKIDGTGKIDASILPAVDEFSDLVDVTGAYTTTGAVYTVNQSKDGLLESKVTLIDSAEDAFSLTQGTSSIEMDYNNLKIDNGIDGISWSAQTSGTAETLNIIWGSSANDVYIVGETGTILRSTNGGTTWTPQTSGTTETLHAVWGSSANDVYISGALGTILHSTDSGTTWTPQTSGVTEPLTFIWGSAANDIYACGTVGTILHSTDGGTTWTPQTSGTTETLRGIWGSSANDIYISGDNGTILHSTDSGTTWTPQITGTTEILKGLWGSAANDIYASGISGVIIHSNDNGATWTARTSGVTEPLAFIWGSAANDIYICGTTGTMLHSVDGGHTWNQKSVPAGDYQGLYGFSSNDVYSCGSSGIISHAGFGPSDPPQLTLSSYNDSVFSPKISINKSRGTKDTSTTVFASDAIFSFLSEGYTGSSYVPAAAISAQVTDTGTIGTGLPTSMSFFTNKTGNTSYNLDFQLSAEEGHLMQVPDNLANGFTIKSGADEYLNINTTTDSEAVEIKQVLSIENGYRLGDITSINLTAYTVEINDTLIHQLYSTTGTSTITLPSAAALINGITYIIKDAGLNAGANPITIVTEGSETIDGQVSVQIDENKNSLTIYAENGNWFIS